MENTQTRFHRAYLWIITICLLLFNATVFAQNGSGQIIGFVQNEGDRFMDKVTVVASMNGKIAASTQTDGKGNFYFRNLVIGGVYSLTFSYVGYETESVKEVISSVRPVAVSIKLRATSTSMEQVVVTALGIKREEKALGYSTTKLSGEQLTLAPSANWTDALSGKVAGLNLIRSNGGPVGTNKIILRGESSLSSSESDEALIVVDGVVINNSSGRRTSIGGEAVYGTSSDNMPADYGSGVNDINSEDIESVEFMKGANAAALYGQRGAHGAVIITMKSGSRKRKGLGVTFNSNTSIEQVNRWPDLQYEYGQGLDGADWYSYGASADGASTSSTSSAYGPRFNGQMFYQFDPVTQKQGTTRTPWVPYKNATRDYFKTGHTTTNSLTVDGGTDKTTARFSVTNVQNDWITPNTGYKRNTVSMSVNSKVNDKLQISSKVNYTNKQSDNLPGAGYGNQSIMYWYIFWQPNADNNWLKNYWVKGMEGKKIEYPFSSFPENPYAIANEFINSMNRNNVTGNIQATYNFTKELSLVMRTSLDMANEQRAQERPYDAGSKYQKGSYREQTIFSNEVNADFLLKYAKKFSKDFDFSATVGGSILRNNYNKEETRADSLNIPGLYSFANTLGPLVSLPWSSKYGINSIYGMITGAYKNYLFLDITGRQDWNSTLATPQRTENAGYFYPSANMALALSDLVKFPSYVDFAKLRFSVAGVGSGGTEPYLTANMYETAGSTYPGGALQNPALIANPNLKPLKTVTYETGAAAKLFKGRLGFDVTLYSSNTKDQHLKRIIDRAAGATQVLINAGEVNNRGIEIALNGTPYTSKNFKWTTSVVFSSNKNEITELADSSVVLQTGPVGGGQLVAKVGGSMGDLYGRGYVRSPDGQIVYDATTGFALISQDVIYLGNTMPKGKVGLTNEFSYKQFRLNVLFDAQYGGVSHSLMHYKLAEQGKTTNTLPGRYSGIIGNGVVLDANGKYVPNTTIATDIDEYYRSHYGVDNAEGSTFSTDFIKFREARLDFALSQKLTQKLHLQKALIGVYGRDLFIWSPWPMFDPEFGTMSGTDIIRGFEVGQFPSTRTMGINLVVGF